MHSFSVFWLHFFIFYIVLLLFNTAHNPNTTIAMTIPVEDVKSVTVEKMVPVIEHGMKMVLMLNESRRKLGNFQICALCTCCARGIKGSYCLPTPCCYGINCNIPNRPFGFCSFTPKTCNCFGCHL